MQVRSHMKLYILHALKKKKVLCIHKAEESTLFIMILHIKPIFFIKKYKTNLGRQTSVLDCKWANISNRDVEAGKRIDTKKMTPEVLDKCFLSDQDRQQP